MRVWKTGNRNRRAQRLPARSPITGDHANGHEKSRDAGGLSAYSPGFQTRIADVQRRVNHAPAWSRMSTSSGDPCRSQPSSVVRRTGKRCKGGSDRPDNPASLLRRYADRCGENSRLYAPPDRVWRTPQQTGVDANVDQCGIGKIIEFRKRKR